MSDPFIYLDYAATTRVDPLVLDAMLPFLQQQFANPSAAYAMSEQVAITQAQQQIADWLQVKPQEIFFTSGATESINWAIKQGALCHKGRHIITSQVEHKATLNVCLAMQRVGWEVTFLPPDASGGISLASVQQAIRPDTALVSLIQVNNETGAITDVAAIGAFLHEQQILFHVDAVQAAARLSPDLQYIDLMSLSAHKFYAPKGIGILYLRSFPPLRIAALIDGGGQQRGLRSGTLPVHQIAAMGKAIEILPRQQDLQAENKRLQQLAQLFLETFAKQAGSKPIQQGEQTVSGILSLSFEDAHAASIMARCPQIALSAGSACNTAGDAPSHVLTAMGVSTRTAQNTLRISFGRWTTAAEIQQAATQIARAVLELQQLARAKPSFEPDAQLVLEDVVLSLRISPQSRVESVHVQAWGAPSKLLFAEKAAQWLQGKTLVEAQACHVQPSDWGFSAHELPWFVALKRAL